MAAVQIKPHGSGFEVHWSDLDVRIVAQNIRPRKDYKARCSVYHRGDPVHRSSPTLDSVSGQDGFVRRLNKLHPKDDFGIDWARVIEDFCGILIDTCEAGVPEVVLGAVEVTEGVRWRVDNLLVENNPTVLWASGGTGKSFFALFLATLVSEGYVDTDHRLVCEPGNVLYLDWETDAEGMAQRTRYIHSGLDVATNSKIIYQKCFSPLLEDVNKILDRVTRHDIDLLVVDSMGLAMGGELESQEAVSAFFRGLADIGKTSLVITHSNKQGDIFGSAYTSNHARMVWEASQTSSNQGSTTDFSLFCRKANDVPRQPPQSWSVTFGDGSVAYKRIDTYETEAAGALSYSNLVKRILLEEGTSPREHVENKIAELKNESVPFVQAKRNAAVAISNHKRTGTVTETDDNKLTFQGEKIEL